ncbi:hypothetical protein GRI44_09740 [Altererythrobacter confluentis]|uniref:Uncharacterized protein n=1 Tax=Allopontixanthobacter confluentis TaxID=1849021 RepID=A0A6L7GJB5_9SPHN|nr:hypothetical protein [Allopontixanthobacter confluentis]MXP15028.1 hypothetical protein [Allopontixanthobacter confluentis]
MAKQTPGDAARGRTIHVWRDAFLAALAESSNVSAAARKAGVPTSTVYSARREDAAFANLWFEALCEGYDNLEMDLLRRLRVGELDGGKAKARRKFDNAIAFRLLTTHREAVSRQKALRADDDEDAILASINAKLDAMRAREKAATALAAENGVYSVNDADAAG